MIARTSSPYDIEQASRHGDQTIVAVIMNGKGVNLDGELDRRHLRARKVSWTGPV